YTIKAWTSMPNGIADTSNVNDTNSVPVQSNLPPPTNIQVTNITGTTADISWTGGSASNSWIYAVVPAGNPIGTGTATTNTNVTVTNLSGLTPYDVYVREVCGNNLDTSAWAGPEPFTTPFFCPPFAYCFTNAGATGSTGPTQ